MDEKKAVKEYNLWLSQNAKGERFMVEIVNQTMPKPPATPYGREQAVDAFIRLHPDSGYATYKDVLVKVHSHMKEFRLRPDLQPLKP